MSTQVDSRHSLEPVRAAKLSEAVYEQLERLIVSKSLSAGERLPSERDLAIQLRVSRNSVREAIHELELKRLVERRPGRGTVVLPSQPRQGSSLLAEMTDDQRDVIEIMDFRLAMEPPIAALAAQRSTNSSLGTLERLIEQMDAASAPGEIATLDEAFHAAVAGATHNRLLVRLHEESSIWLRQIRREALQTRARREASMAGHRRILEAIRAGDAEAAAGATAEHVRQVRHIIETGM